MFLKKFFSKKIEAAAKKLVEAMPSSGSIDDDERMYRKLTGNPDRDLRTDTHDRMLDIAYFLYKKNPMARRIVELTKDFIVGEGIEFEAEDENVKTLLEDFWDDPVNLWDLKQDKKACELGLYGEQCYSVFINDVDGHVRLGYIDPKLIEAVVPDLDNCEVIKEIKLKGAPGEERVLKAINLDDDINSPTYGMLVGECFFFAVNKVSNATRGISDLFALADWLDGYDQFLFNRLDRVSLINAFVWDVTLEGMTQEQIMEWMKSPANGTPRPGSVRAHNDKVKWEAITPSMHAGDAADEGRMIKNHILSGAGFPEHWFAEGGNANRATAAEMGEPTIKRLKARQKYFKYMIEFIFRFVIDQAIIHGTLHEKVNTKFQVIMPEISVKDTKGIASALQQITSSTAMAQQYGWISKETAANIFAGIASQLGFEINVKDEMKAIEKYADKDSEQDYRKEK